MNRMDEFDALKNENWGKVYADVPDSVHAGVQFAFMRIRAQEKRRKNAMRVLACAACLALVIGMAALMLGRSADAPDRVAAPNVELRVLKNSDIVYAARADACFHVYGNCSEAMAEQVELQLVTALEFEKELCRVCGAKVQLPEETA